jgi:hypothetical protein
MRKYIHAYNIIGRGVVGSEVDSWSGDELGDNKPFVISHESSLSGYTNITSIKNFERFCDSTTHSHRIQIEYLYNETTWEDLELEEKNIVAKYFLVDKDKRDEVLTEEEQDSYNYFKIYDLVSDDVYTYKNINNKHITPKSIDYKREIDGRLHPKYTFDSSGWLIECEYFTNLEIWQNAQGFTQYDYSNPILKYQASYQVKDDGYVGTRTVTRRWYRLDGTLDPDAKITQKSYEPMASREEGFRRRKNLVNNLIIQTVGLIIMTSVDLHNVSDAETDAMEFMKYVAPGISEYYEYGNKKDINNSPVRLVQLVMNSTYVRLNNFVPGTNNTVTIRDYIISKLDI